MSKYMLINVFPKCGKMVILTTQHNSKSDLIRELERMCFELEQIEEILSGNTYMDTANENLWLRVIDINE